MKTVNVKKQFVKKNFLILFSAFVLPTLILEIGRASCRDRVLRLV